METGLLTHQHRTSDLRISVSELIKGGTLKAKIKNAPEPTMITWEATYHRKGINPFIPRLGELVSALGPIKRKAQVSSETPTEQVEKWAREKTSFGYTFRGITKI